VITATKFKKKGLLLQKIQQQVSLSYWLALCAKIILCTDDHWYL